MNTHRLNVSKYAVGDEQLPYSVLNSEMTVTVNNKEYIVVKKTRGNKIEAGKTYLVQFSNGDSGYNVETCNGYVAGSASDKVENVKWQTVKDIYQTFGVKSMKALDEVDYDQTPHMNVTSQLDNRTGSYYYIYEGRWVWGSSCDSLAFYELKEFDEVEHNTDLANKAEAERVEKLSRQIENKQMQIARLQHEVAELVGKL